MVYNASMNRRYYLVIFIILFAAALWGLITTFDANTVPSPSSTAIINATVVPQPAQQ